MQGTVADVQGLGPEPAPAVHRLLQRPRRAARDQRADPDLVPQLRHDAVRRPRAHRDAGRHGLGRDRPGLRRRRAGEVVRAPGGDGAGAERGQAAAHRRPPSTSTSPTRSGSAFPTRRSPAGTSTSATACPTSGLALRADRRGEDPAAGADHLARVVRAAEREPAGDGGDRRPPVGRPRGGLHVPAPVGARHRARRGGLPRGERPDADVRLRRLAGRDRPRLRCAPSSTCCRTAARPWTRPRPPRGPATRTRTSPRSPCGSWSPTPPGNRAEDRKMLFAYRDATLHEGWSKDLGTGGEASPRLFDLDGDNELDTVLADSSGELRVLHADGTPLSSFNNGQPVRTRLYPNVHPGARVLRRRSTRRARCCARPRSATSTATWSPRSWTPAGEHVYAWEADGSAVPGFPVRLDPALSRPAGPHAQQPHQARLHRLAGARRPERGRRPRDRRAGARPAPLRLGRQRQPDARLPEEAARPERSRAPRSSPPPRSATSPVTASSTSSRPPRSSTTTRPRPRRRAAARPAASRTSSPTSSPTCSAAAGACTRWTATATCCRAGPRRRTASCRTRCRSSAPASTTCSRTWTPTPSWRRSATSPAAT